MKLSEIAEYIIEKYPNCCMSYNNDVVKGCREKWYEESLVDPLMDFFSYELLHLCGCGTPEDTYELIRKFLTIRFERQSRKISYEEVIRRYKDDLKLDTNNSSHYGILQFVMYILDHNDILDHGSSIGGCWLTNLGEMYLIVLNAWHDREENN